MVTLDQIRAFVAVAEELHFGRAAERLRMTQPPLSRHIQKLERAIGVTLLERDNRRVILTEAGRGFLEDARHMLTLVETAGDRARRIAAGASGTLRLGFTAVSAISVLGGLLRLLAERLPEVDVILHEEVTARQMDGILRGELDLGLARPPFDLPHPTSGFGTPHAPSGFGTPHAPSGFGTPHAPSRLGLPRPLSGPTVADISADRDLARPPSDPTVAGVSSELDLARVPIDAVHPAATRPSTDINAARPTYHLAGIDSRVIFREPLCAAVPTGHVLAALDRPLAPEDFAGLPMVSYHPVRSRYFHELTVRFLSAVRPRAEQQVHQILTAVLLVAAGRGVALVPASARSLGIEGVVFRDLVHGGGSPPSGSRSGNPMTGNEGDEPATENDGSIDPVELHAVWNPGSANPALWRVLDLLDDVEGQG
ncbi:LysR family transcriptional regulator [Nonomuraea wenchangensis]|uniref:LysR substrate binding domain-containing protein n=1 Tax=Nonomuraea wenchangensis TaxID=568860 RepID=A0A1I0KIY9_9ACTN|nr:LysR substrate-binding domain-containing protein [Nonomuraea wenchangensis]SEU24668.1 LysR substrate binding domain-containing protein [Nonomuraea wenchangensis]